MAALDPQAHIVMLERELEWARLKIQVLEERLRQRRIQLLGPHSETLSDLQLELLADEEPGVTGEEVEAEARREPLPQKPVRERKPHPGRRSLPENLPRIEQVVRCAEPNCKRCGAETSIIGYDESEVLDVAPAHYFVRVTKREKRACAKCATIAMPELAPRIVEKGLASDGVVIQTVIAKYCDHLPLYRQQAMLEREAGVEISRATLDGWVMRVGDLLQPVVRAMRQDLLRAPLTEFAVEAFRKQIAISGPGPYLFPNPDNPSGYQASFKKVWATTRRKAGIPYFRIYDLRSTYATRLSAGGVADEWVTQLLRQGDAKVFKKYSQMKLQMKREALAKLNRKANDKGSSGTGEAA